MDFNTRLKAKITQSILECLFEDAKYKVVPLGVEQVLREIKCLHVSDYLKVGLPETLRCLPDFFISPPGLENGFLVEVKYRKRWDKITKLELGEKILEQAKQWGSIHLVLFLGEPMGDDKKSSSYLGVCKLMIHKGQLSVCQKDLKDKNYFISWDNISWKSFKPFQCIFDGPPDRWVDSSLDNAVSMTKMLTQLKD